MPPARRACDHGTHMSHRTIDPAGLKQWMDDGREFVLLDVLPREAYEEGHLPA